MNISMEAPIKTETVPIFTYQPRNFISTENPKTRNDNNIIMKRNPFFLSKRTINTGFFIEVSELLTKLNLRN